MFNTMTMTKVFGALFGALLFFLLASWAASGLYSTAADGHGEDGPVQGYIIATLDDGHGDGGDEEADVVEEPPVEVAIVGDAAAGEKVFKKCKACHKIEEGVKAVGPDLFAVVGRGIGAREGFKYSDGMLAQGGEWDAALLDTFLTDPKAMVAGTKMSFRGLSKPEDRANVIAYLATIGG